MGNFARQVSVQLRPAIKDSGMTTREAADVSNVAWETLRGYIYKDKLPSVESLYFIAAGIKQPIRIPGPHGTVVVRLEEGGAQAASATTLPFRKEWALAPDPMTSATEPTIRRVRVRRSRRDRSYNLLQFVVAVIVPLVSLVIALVHILG